MAGLFICGFCFIKASYAACPAVSYANPPATMNLDPTLPIGAVVATTNVSFPFADYTCGVSSSSSYLNWRGIGVPNGNLYPLPVTGLAYRASFAPGSDWASVLGTGFFPLSYYQPYIGSKSMSGGTVKLEFIKTGPIGLGSIPAQDIVYFLYDELLVVKIRLSGPIPVKPVIRTCTTSTPVVTVPLDSVTANSFSNVADTAKEKTFSIKLSCPDPVNVSWQFSGDVIDSTQAVFRNTNATTGSSIGIQILKDGNPVPNGAGNFVNLGIVTNEVTTEFSARYYALVSNVQVGNVSAIANATIVYN